jgi:hypothetical protein
VATQDLTDALNSLKAESSGELARLLDALIASGESGLEAAWREIIGEALDEA